MENKLQSLLPCHDAEALRECIAQAELQVPAHVEHREDAVFAAAVELAFALPSNEANDQPPPPPPPPRPDPSRNELLEALKSMFSNADPAWLAAKLDSHIRKELEFQDLVDIIINMKDRLPTRQTGTTKRKWNDDGELEDEVEKKPKLGKDRDYSKIDPAYVRDTEYFKYSPHVLSNLFQTLPKYYIISVFNQNGRQLIPSYLALEQALKEPNNLPCKPKKSNRPEYPIPKTNTGILELELKALEELRAANHIPETKDNRSTVIVVDDDEDEDAGEDGIECGCCYVDYPMQKMTQCDDGHLFCLECARKAAENLIGLRKTAFSCLDSSGCKFMFPRVEIERFLSPAVLAGYDRLLQEESLRVAGISGLTECPFCDYAVVMDTDPEIDRLFNCASETCGVISCRLCKRKNHLPATCEEAAKDDVLAHRHKVEEAMTQALLRTCPTCSSQFFKDEGCNKMMCPKCQTITCYVCKAVIRGYDHFNQDPSGTAQAGNSCPLWDNSVQRNAEEVQQAAKRAIEETKRDNPEVDEQDIHVELPVVPPAPPAPQPFNHRNPAAMGFAYQHRPVHVPRIDVQQQLEENLRVQQAHRENMAARLAQLRRQRLVAAQQRPQQQGGERAPAPARLTRAAVAAAAAAVQAPAAQAHRADIQVADEEAIRNLDNQIVGEQQRINQQMDRFQEQQMQMRRHQQIQMQQPQMRFQEPQNQGATVRQQLMDRIAHFQTQGGRFVAEIKRLQAAVAALDRDK